MRQIRFVVVAALVVSSSASVGAQLPGGHGSSMGVGRSPGRDDPALKEIGPELELRLANGVNIIIAHGRELSLTPEQLSRVVVIKRRLDSLNTPLMRELDSLEHANRTHDPVQRSRGDLPDAPNPVLEQTLGDLRANLHNAELDAYDVLSGTQAQRAMQMVKEARANAALAVGRDKSED
jgi:hypothetical protein